MNCEETKYQFLDLIEGTITLQETEQINKHLLSCNDCRNFHNELESTFALIDDERVSKTKPEFTETVLQSVQSNTEVLTFNIYSRVKIVLSYAAVVAIGMFLGTITAYLISERSTDLSTKMNQEFYLNNLDSEPIESFLISKSN